MSILSVKTPTSRFVVGPHSLVVRNGITFNDRSQTECYWVDEFNGFERPDLNTPAEQNPQEDGETAFTPPRGGRTMTLSGDILSGSYDKALTMAADLEDSLIDLLELSMVIKTAAGSTFFTHPDIEIFCRPTDWTIDKKLRMDDKKGLFRRTFSVALRASNPRYTSVASKTATMAVAGLIFPSGGGGFTFPAGGGGLAFPAHLSSQAAIDLGNWPALSVIRFQGLLKAGSTYVLTNTTNGQVMKINGPIAAGNWIEVDTYTGEVKDQAGVNAAEQFDSTSDWIQLEGKRGGSSGSNALTLDVIGSADPPVANVVSLTFDDTWMSA